MRQNEKTLKTKEWQRTEEFLAEFKNFRTNRAVTGPPFGCTVENEFPLPVCVFVYTVVDFTV